MAPKYIPNDLPLQSLDREPLPLMKSSLERILKATPPQPAYLDPAQHGGFIEAQPASPISFSASLICIQTSKWRITISCTGPRNICRQIEES